MIRSAPLALLLLVFFQTSPSLQAQTRNFPKDWEGEWQGVLQVFAADSLRQSIDMRLRIAPADSGRWEWTLQYGQDDRREYFLVPIDPSKGHFQIDENNSILLDAALNGNVLSSRFSVKNSLLLVNYRLEGKTLIFEVIYGPSDRPQTTGEALPNEGPIRSYPLAGRQVAYLRRL